MKKNFLTITLAVLGLALPAMAQVQSNLGDLILGFRATGGQGQNVNLEVDLGSVAQFQGQPAGTTLVVSRLAASDLVAIYGANWATRTDLYWGIIGTNGRVSSGPNGSLVGTLWATNAEEPDGSQSPAWIPGSRSAQNSAASTIEPLFLGAPASLNGATPTSNSSFSAAINATTAGSYSVQETFQANVGFGFFNPTIDNGVKPVTGSYAVSDLYELNPGDTISHYLGSFGLASNGSLTFSGSASYFSSATAGAPAITTAPASQSVVAGSNVTFTVAASGTSPLSYQWYNGSTAISGATNSTLTLSGVTSANAGNYSVKVSNSSGSITSTGFSLTVGAVPNPGRLINLSVLTTLSGPGDNFTFGFTVGGAGTSGNKPMLMRAGGPSLTQFNGYSTANVLSDPVMVFYSGSTKVTQNIGWGSGDQSILTAAAAVGAYPFLSTTSKDSAIYVSAVPVGGDSIVISGNGASTGSVLAELYDSTPSAQFNSTTPRLINVSVLKNVGPIITVGFVVGGSTNMNVLVRASGPSIVQFNVAGAMADPKLTLFNSAQTAVASNDDWGTPLGTGAATAAQLSSAASAVGAFALTPGSKDAAILQTLAPGSYTVQVSASTGSTGIALLEVYEVP